MNFRLDYVNASGDISNYYPDFIVKKSEKEIFIVETKCLEDLDVALKMERLKQWCMDINKAQSVVRYDYVFVDEESFNKYQPKSFAALLSAFRSIKTECREFRDRSTGADCGCRCSCASMALAAARLRGRQRRGLGRPAGSTGWTG